MRPIAGTIVLPADAPAGRARRVLIEVRDVSLADAPSTVVAEQALTDVALRPHGRIGLNLDVPEVGAARTLSLRVHVDLDGSGQTKTGDLLTVASQPVPSRGPATGLTVPVALI
jgi:putative lipoprotein